MPIEIDGIKVYTVNELSKMLDVTPLTLRKYIKQGKLRAQKIGKRYMVTYESLKEFLNGTYNTPQKGGKIGKKFYYTPAKFKLKEKVRLTKTLEYPELNAIIKKRSVGTILTRFEHKIGDGHENYYMIQFSTNSVIVREDLLITMKRK